MSRNSVQWIGVRKRHLLPGTNFSDLAFQNNCLALVQADSWQDIWVFGILILTMAPSCLLLKAELPGLVFIYSFWQLYYDDHLKYPRFHLVPWLQYLYLFFVSGRMKN